MARVLRCLLLLLLVSIIATGSTTLDAAVPLAALTHFPSFVYHQFGRNFSDQQKKCIEDGPPKCPWLYSVTEEDPCQNGEWFVYNRTKALRVNGSFEVVCQPRPCPPEHSLLIPEQKCYRNEDLRDICTKEELSPITFYTNLFGETFCSCGPYEAILLNSRKKECHRLFTQGPCPRGSLFVPVYDLVNFGQGRCVASPCAEQLYGENSMAEIRLPDGRRECFELWTQGPCRNNYKLVIDDGVFPGVPYLECAFTGAGGESFSGTVPYAKSDRCIEDDKGECHPRIKEEIRHTRPLELEF